MNAFYNAYQQVLIEKSLLFQKLLQKIKLIIKNHLSFSYPPDLYKRYPPNAEKTSHKIAPMKAFVVSLLDTKGCKIAKTKEANAILRKSFPNSSNNFFISIYKRIKDLFCKKHIKIWEL
ncbi:hypothetical protein [Persephonella sp. KM09-Lau-8]|uniref:hypothetical protein n=1 Tax=Persephonella sp. KM09-Lau-8 TaxID=1158345 RepID=UPI000496085D|nr:hypothetical protein [Persephonella sp. KM09-Lau-8]